MSLPLTAVVVCSRVQQVRVDRIEEASPCLSFTLTFCLPVWCLSIHIYLSIWVAAVHVHVHCRSQFGSSNRLLSLSLSVACCRLLSPVCCLCLCLMRCVVSQYPTVSCPTTCFLSQLPENKILSLLPLASLLLLALQFFFLSFFSFFFFFQFCF